MGEVPRHDDSWSKSERSGTPAESSQGPALKTIDPTPSPSSHPPRSPLSGSRHPIHTRRHEDLVDISRGNHGSAGAELQRRISPSHSEATMRESRRRRFLEMRHNAASSSTSSFKSHRS